MLNTTIERQTFRQRCHLICLLESWLQEQRQERTNENKEKQRTRNVFGVVSNLFAFSLLQWTDNHYRLIPTRKWNRMADFQVSLVSKLFRMAEIPNSEFSPKLTLKMFPETKTSPKIIGPRVSEWVSEWCSVNVVADCFDCCSLDCSLFRRWHTRDGGSQWWGRNREREREKERDRAPQNVRRASKFVELTKIVMKLSVIKDNRSVVC